MRIKTWLPMLIAGIAMLVGCGDDGAATISTSEATTPAPTSAPAATTTTTTTTTVPTAVDETPIVWVTGTTEEGEGRIAKVDGGTGEVLGVLEIGDRPRQMAFGAGALWVTDCLVDRVYRIDPGTLTLQATIATAACPSDIVVADGRVLVATTREPGLSRIDPAINTVAGTMEFDSSPTGLAVGSVLVALSDGRVFLFEPSLLDGSGTPVPVAEVRVDGSIERAIVVSGRLVLVRSDGIREILDAETLEHLGEYDTRELRDPAVIPRDVWGIGDAILGALDGGVLFYGNPDVFEEPLSLLPSLPGSGAFDPDSVVVGGGHDGQMFVTTADGSLYFWRLDPLDDLDGLADLDPDAAWGAGQDRLEFEPLDLSTSSRSPDEGGYEPVPCPGLREQAPAGEIEAVLRDPGRVTGWGMREEEADDAATVVRTHLRLLDMTVHWDPVRNQFTFASSCP